MRWVLAKALKRGAPHPSSLGAHAPRNSHKHPSAHSAAQLLGSNGELHGASNQPTQLPPAHTGSRELTVSFSGLSQLVDLNNNELNILRRIPVVTSTG